MTTRGVLYVAYGRPARTEATASIATLRHHHPHLSVTVLSDTPLGDEHTILSPDAPDDPGARRIKLAAPEFSPYDHTLYLDADTRIHGDLSPLFAIIERWPLTLTFSSRQGADVLGNCPYPDRTATFDAAGTPDLLGLQCGVIGFQTCNGAVRRLFRAWREEFGRHGDRDQGAFLRALHREPLPLWLIGRDFNGGALVEHRYGTANRTRRMTT